MEEDTNLGTEVFSLLQPELLSERELREILTSRCVARNLFNLTKSELVELFRNVALPLPQREYGTQTWREKLLSKKQQRTKRTISFSNSDSSSSKTEPVRKLSRLTDEKLSPQERLKPPPDLINYKRKVIKLSDSSNSKTRADLDKIVIKAKEKSEPIAQIQSHNSRPNETPEINGKKISDPKAQTVSTNAVKLKRDSVAIKDEKLEETKKEESSSKKKRQKIVISW